VFWCTGLNTGGVWISPAIFLADKSYFWLIKMLQFENNFAKLGRRFYLPAIPRSIVGVAIRVRFSHQFAE